MKGHTTQQYRDCVWVWGCQCAQICSLTMLHVSHPYLVSLSLYAIPICLFFKFAVFFIYLQMVGAMCMKLCRNNVFNYQLKNHKQYMFVNNNK